MILARRRPKFLPDPDQGESSFLGDLLRSETVGGAIALAAAAAALIWANIDISTYQHFRHVKLGPLDIEQWAADGALSIFFFVAGLELKREFLVGSLRKPADAAVPVVAAACGVAVPALIYVIANHGTSNLGGWAIPAATDIAFALAVLAVVGSALPTQLRAFLLTLAVVDDLIVIAIIAVFYSSSISLWWLLAALACGTAYFVLQQQRVTTGLVYLPLAAGMWWSVHESGIHATIAGVALGLLTRVLPDPDEPRSPAERLEHRIVPISAGVAVPFFALMSAGVVLTGGFGLARQPIVLGVALGLVLGKPVGILGGSWLLTRFTRAEIDEDVSWRDLVGVAILAGVGFTVSLLVSDLSFAGVRREEAKTAVLLGSLIAAVVAGLILRRRNREHASS
ncbi:MAG: Na+/H+ antiporter NhaA [Marmoricola sp.]|jgi:NhaA family Na+:H+ antiporter|nr:Na+/H+ antiporter NhaA [Marmoricola sp.]